MTNESCHSEDPDSSGDEESLLLNDEILRPEKIGTQDDIFIKSHCGPDPQSIFIKSHSALDAESIYALDAETSLSR